MARTSPRSSVTVGYSCGDRSQRRFRVEGGVGQLPEPCRRQGGGRRRRRPRVAGEPGGGGAGGGGGEAGPERGRVVRVELAEGVADDPGAMAVIGRGGELCFPSEGCGGRTRID